MDMDEETEVAVAQFMSLTNATREVAVKYLEDAEGDMNVALENFGDTGDEFVPKMSVAPPKAKKKENDYYAGGASSGIAVQAPDEKDSFFDNYRKAGAVSAEEHEATATKGKAKAFVGHGYSLGDGSSGSSVHGESLAALRAKEKASKPLEVHISFFKNGFTVEYEGCPNPALRSPQDPANRAFLEHVEKGAMPPELVALTRERGVEIDAHVVDKRGEDYVPPKKVIQSFTGAGNRLGSPTATVAQAQAQASSSFSFSSLLFGSGASAQPAAQAPAAPLPAPVLDPSRPQTKVQVRLADGTRLVAHFHETDTVADIRAFINRTSPQTRAFVLVTPPSKEIADESATLVDAKLLNAVVIQKLK